MMKQDIVAERSGKQGAAERSCWTKALDHRHLSFRIQMKHLFIKNHSNKFDNDVASIVNALGIPPQGCFTYIAPISWFPWPACYVGTKTPSTPRNIHHLCVKTKAVHSVNPTHFSHIRCAHELFTLPMRCSCQSRCAHTPTQLWSGRNFFSS